MNYSRRVLFLGSADLYVLESGGKKFETRVPAIYAFECAGRMLGLLDKFEVGGEESTLGVNSIVAHAHTNIIFASFNTHVVIAILDQGKFVKFRVVQGFSEGPVYRLQQFGNSLSGLCWKGKRLVILRFGKTRQRDHKERNVGWDNTDECYGIGTDSCYQGIGTDCRG